MCEESIHKSIGDVLGRKRESGSDVIPMNELEICERALVIGVS